MAEDRRKKKRPAWAGILAAIVMLGAIILTWMYLQDEPPQESVFDEDPTILVPFDEDSIDTAEQNRGKRDAQEMKEKKDTLPEVSKYISHIGDKERMGLEHEYTNNALIHLTEALRAKAEQLNVDIEVPLREIRKEAKAITENPKATTHANTIKNTGIKIAEALKTIQEEKFPELSKDAEEVKAAVREIDKDVLTLEQKGKINTFFEKAGNLLQKMDPK